MDSLAAIERPGASPASPTLVLLHGFGADERDLMGLAGSVDPAWSVICPAAPIELPWGGRAWFDVEFLPDGGRRYDGTQARAAADLVAAWLGGLAAERPDAPILLGGFSQGAMMAWAAAQRRPDVPRGLWLMSGMPVPEAAVDGARVPVPTLVQHGLGDDVIPVALGRALSELAAAAGAATIYREYPMGHGIGEASLADGAAWLRGLGL